MNVLIVGAGAIGIAVGATLVSSQVEVSFLARERTKNAILSDGIHRTGLFGSLDYTSDRIRYTVSNCLELPEHEFDFILVCTKTMANEETGAMLWENRRILRENGKIVILQNGWGNDLPYLEHFPKEQVCSARVITGFQRSAPNSSEITVHTGDLLLGNLYGLDPTPLLPLADAINRGGIPCKVTEDVSKALWAKMLYNCTLNPLGAVLGVPYGKLAECPQTVDYMNDLISEIFAVMKAAGYSTYWETPEAYRAEFYSTLVPNTYEHCSSTLQDIRKKQKTEIDTLTGRILALGTEHHIPTPANLMLYRLIKAMEANF